MRWLNSPWGRRVIGALALIALIGCAIALAEPLLRSDGTVLSYQDRISLCGFAITAVIALSAIPQLVHLADTSRSVHYSQLDTTYFELLRMAVDKPCLRDPTRIDKDDKESRDQYESYAFSIWNFVETVRDRCEDDQALKDIWAPVIVAEHLIHGAWFYRETTPYSEHEAPKFRLQFADFIWKRFGSQTDPACGNVLHEKSTRWIRQSWKLRSIKKISRDDTIRHLIGQRREHALPDWVAGAP